MLVVRWIWETVNEAVYGIFLYTQRTHRATLRNEPVLRHPILLPARSARSTQQTTRAQSLRSRATVYRRVPLALPATAFARFARLVPLMQAGKDPKYSWRGCDRLTAFRARWEGWWVRCGSLLYRARLGVVKTAASRVWGLVL